MQEMVSIFKALSEETRLRILKLLENGELCVCDIVAALDMVQPKVSFHLNVLKEAGFLKDRKEGRWIHYSIDDSDFLRRFLLLSVLERIDGEPALTDNRKLEDFLKRKTSKESFVRIGDDKGCCGSIIRKKTERQVSESAHEK